MMKRYWVKYKLTEAAWLGKEVNAENEKDAKAAAKEYFISVVGKDRVNDTYKNKNVVCAEINEPIIREDHQED